MARQTDQIFEYLLSNSPQTVTQLSQALRLTRADIRHHLSALMEEGRVTKAGQVSADHGGRPAERYRAIQPLNRVWLETLLPNLFQLLRQLGVSEEGINRELANLLLANFHPNGHITARLSQAMQSLKSIGLSAHWIAGSQGPLITISPTEFLPPALASALVEKIQKEL